MRNRSAGDYNWKRAHLPKALGGLRIRSAEESRGELGLWSLAFQHGSMRCRCVVQTSGRGRGREERREMCSSDCTEKNYSTPCDAGFSETLSRALQLRDIQCRPRSLAEVGHDREGCTYLELREGVGSSRTDACSDEGGMYICGLRREKGDHRLACQRNPWQPRVHNRVRDSLPQN